MEKDQLWLTAITEKNYQHYEPLLPPVYAEEFCRNSEILGMGANVGNQAAGIMLYQTDPKLPYCRILYVSVSPSHQRQGIATKMLLTLTKAAYEKNKYATAAFFADSSDDPVFSLFAATGEFTISPEDGAMFSGSKKDIENALRTLDTLRKGRELPPAATLGECTPAQKNHVIEEINKAGFDADILLAQADPDLSLIHFDEKGGPRAMVLVEALREQKGFLLSFAWTNKDSVAVMFLLGQTLAGLYKVMDEESVIEIAAVSDRVREVIQKLSADTKPVSRLYTASYNGEDIM